MSWRGDNNDKKRKPAKQSKPSNPAQSKSSNPAPSQKKDRGNWRKAGAAASSEQKRSSWGSGGGENTSEAAMYTHRLKIMVLGGVLLVASIFAIASVISTARSVPLIVINMTDYMVEDEHSFLGVNPFAEEDANRFASVNPGNVSFVRAKQATLKEVQRNDDSISRELRDSINPPIPGGPGKDFFIFYVSAYGAVNETGDACLLLTNSTVNKSDSWLPVKRLIDQIELASGAAKGTKTLVLLDVKFPEPIGENALDDGDFAIKAKSLFDSKQNFFSKNTFVLLAADTGQRSWTSAELGGSVFAYFSATGLNGDADSADDADEMISLGEFTDYVENNVASWVAQHRGDSQTPMLLTTNTELDEAKLSSMAFVGTPKPLKSGGTVPTVSRRVEGKDSLLSLWESHQRLKDAEVYRKHPVLWGRAEAKLIRLEQLLETGPSSAFDSLMASATSDFLTLTKTSQRTARLPMSLVERQILGPAFNPELSSRATSWKTKLPPYLQPPRPDGLIPAIALLEKDEAAWLTWSWLDETADDDLNSKSPVNYTLDHETLEKILAFIDGEDRLDNNPRGVEWIEIQFLRLLESELDWKAVDEKKLRNRVIRQAIRARTLSQRAAIWSDPAVHYWIRTRVDGVEDHRRIAEDHLLAGQFVEASQQFEEVIKELKVVSQFGEAISQALSIKDQALVELPHFLALDRRQQKLGGEAGAAPSLADDKGKSNEAGTDVAGPKDAGTENMGADPLVDLWSETFELAFLLRMENKGSVTINKLRITTNRVEKLLKDHHQDFQQHVESLLDNARNGRRHRQIQTALRTGLVMPSDRKRLYAKLLKIIEEDKSIASSDIDEVEVATDNTKDAIAFAKRFENRFTDSALKDAFELIAVKRWDEYQGDRLDAIVEHLKKLKKDASVGNDERYRTSVSAANDLFKTMALFLAFRVEQDDIGRTTVEQIARDAYDLHSHYERVWHAERTLADFWGSTREQGDEHVYFWDCSNAYLKMATRLRSMSSLVIDFNARADAKLRAIKQHTVVSSLVDILFSKTEKEKRHRVRVDFSDGLPHGFAKIRFEASQNIIPFVDYESDESTRGHVVEVLESKNSQTFEHFISVSDLMKIDDRKLRATLSFRGHRPYRDLKLREKPWVQADKFVKIEFDKRPYEPPVVTVRGSTSGMIDVLFIMDCSNSMNKGIVIEESGKIVLTRHEAAKNSLSGILDRMGEESGRYRIGLMAFGHRARWTGKGWETQRFDDPGVYVPTDVEVVHPLNGSKLPTDIVEISELKQKLRGLRAAGSTPLYLSIIRGLEHLQMRKREGIKQRLIIVSDGENWQEGRNQAAVNAGSMPDNYRNTTFADLKQFAAGRFPEVGIDLVHYQSKSEADAKGEEIADNVSALTKGGGGTTCALVTSTPLPSI